jgi:hypothetical protein
MSVDETELTRMFYFKDMLVYGYRVFFRRKNLFFSSKDSVFLPVKAIGCRSQLSVFLVLVLNSCS